MRNVFVVSAAAAIFAGSAAGQQAATKVGIMSIQGAVAGTRDGQKAAQELDKRVAPKQKEFDSRQSELTKLQDQYNAGAAVMAEEKRVQVMHDIDEKKKRLERDIQDSEEQLRAEQQKMLQDIGKRMIAVIDKYGKDHNYALILDDSNPNTPLLYSATTMDITQDIIALYDQSTGTGGGVPKGNQ